MSNPDLVQYIVEQALQACEVTAKKMFGDYCLYCDGKVVGLICDDYLYLKPLPQLQSLLHECDQNVCNLLTMEPNRTMSFPMSMTEIMWRC